MTPLQSSFCAFFPVFTLPDFALPFELPDFPLLPSRFSLRSDISVSVLDPEEDDDGDGGEHVGDLITMRGGLACWWRGDGDTGEVGVGVV